MATAMPLLEIVGRYEDKRPADFLLDHQPSLLEIQEIGPGSLIHDRMTKAYWQSLALSGRSVADWVSF